ncbi:MULTISPECIES: hypothetical protein [unclassified Yoonia]|uniref:hypothetical protein n=1 Tax=unclassified Yoonia TaxID=2629118 RepID=UPI002AFE0702|nr:MULTISPECIES: hypothetical protein [unclassified Yoonia]
MPFVVKTGSINANIDEIIEVVEKPFYGGKNIVVGAELFLWSSETQGGVGLWGRGVVTNVALADPKLSVRTRITHLASTANFGLEQIAPHRDSTTNDPVVGLARKLYKHSHNKIAQITDDEAILLQQCFG